MNEITECPWSWWSQSPPQFCERALCTWIREPGNTWTNIGFLIAAYIIWPRSRDKRSLPLIMLALASGLTGLGSAFYHASGTLWAGNADLLGMFTVTGAMTALNLKRWLKGPALLHWAVFILISGGLFTIAQFFPGYERWIFSLSGPCCWIELRLFFRDRGTISYRYYGFAWLSIGVATFFWWVDVRRIFCLAENHFLSGHGVWHLLCALGFYFIYRFYEPLGENNDRR